MIHYLSGVAALWAVQLSPQATDEQRQQAVVPPPVESSPDEVIEAQLERYRRLTVPVLIEGSGPYRFMVDTGAQATAITESIVEQLQLRPAGSAMLVGMASRELVPLAEIRRLELGTWQIDELRAPVLKRANVGADGIIGLDALQDMRVLLDFRDGSISVASASEAEPDRRYDIIVRAKRRGGQLLITRARVGGIRTAVVIDTGSQGSIGNLALRSRLRAKVEGQHVSTDVLGNQITGDVGLVRKVEIGGMELTNLQIAFADAPAFEALGLHDQPTLALGMDHLRLFERVAIDFDRKRVLFDLPRDKVRPQLKDVFQTSPGG